MTNQTGDDCCEFKIDSSVIMKLVPRVQNSGRRLYRYLMSGQLMRTYAFGIPPEKTSLKSRQGTYEFVASIPPNFLNEGTYYVGIAIHSFEGVQMLHVHEQDALVLNVKDNIAKRPYPYTGPIAGVVRPQFDTSLEVVGLKDSL